jgi:L-seryl-tRNA(Ser) seleniumtransferase
MREVERLLQQLTGAEAAAVVNNNAAATLLALTALAHGREVVVSRGQLVEIGGSFRLPEVMTSAGAHLREVGTTNKTRLSDYQEAISAETAALMRVHSSNYRIVGFTEQVSLEDLVALGRRRRVPVIDDIGSGALLDLSKYGVEGEPIAADSIKAGADLVLFSGDKLLGGPQCGIIVGRKVYVERIASHPMMRALRVDKTVLAALAATLRLYRDPAAAEQSVPLLSLLGTPLENLKLRASRLAPQMAAVEAIAEAEAIEDVAYLGGGSVPSQELATWCIALKPANGSVEKLAQSLRTGTPSLFGRIKQDRLLLDLRSVAPRYDTQVVAAVEALDRSEPRNDKDAGKTEGAPGESTSSAAEHIAAESTGS